MWKLVSYLTRYQTNKYEILALKKLIEQRNDWINWIRHFRTNWLKHNINCKWLEKSLHRLLLFSHSASDFKSFQIHFCLLMKKNLSEMIDRNKSVIKLELSWVERDQLNLSLSLSWDWVDSSQLELNSESSWIAWTQFLLLNIVYYVLKIVYFFSFFSNFFFAINFAINLIENLIERLMRNMIENIVRNMIESVVENMVENIMRNIVRNMMRIWWEI